MIAGLSGSLLSHDALEQLLSSPQPAVELQRTAAQHKTLRAWHAGVRGRFGPSASARTVFDLVADPLARALGYHAVPVASGGAGATLDALLQAGNVTVAVMVVSAWAANASGLWRHAVHRGLAHEVRWGFCVSGPTLRIVDVDRPYARRFAELDLATVIEHDASIDVLVGIFGAAAVAARPRGSTLEKVIDTCERHRAAVRLSLRDGVQRALVTLVGAFRAAAAKRHGDSRVLNESLIVIYRILFLLFAEARGLVPRWHPVYAESYTIESAASGMELMMAPAGLWETLQAVARLAHRGCRAGTLRVPPFNGRLFSPADAPLADTLPLDDRVVSDALAALTTTCTREGRARISYADLGVEQLGGIYEHLLDLDLAPGSARAPAALVPTGRRKATGSFYTPRALTEFIVRRTLAPLVRDRSADAILALRVLDPAMGSGAFLVAACRYLGAAYEQALIREGHLTAGDLDARDRAQFRRAVAQRCLFGVDVNPMAVQLGRLSLWLATLASDKPLTFLDHHLRPGNSLVGASIDDVLHQSAPGRSRRRTEHLPLFDDGELRSSLEAAVGTRATLVATPDDTLRQVRDKEQTLAWLNRAGGPLERWKATANLWCSAWYDGGAGDRATFGALVDHLLRESSVLPSQIAEPLLARAGDIARRECFFHWTLEFPEVFYDAHGEPLPDAGFDAVIGNPPWDMLRDEGGSTRTSELTAFVRGSGQYPLHGRGHANLYHLFVERALALLRPGGRCGLIVPAGFGSDQAGALLRRHLFERTCIDTFTTLENRDGIFPIHRSLKFLLLTFGNDGRTIELPTRAGVRAVEVVDRVADQGSSSEDVRVPVEFIARTGGETLAVPEIRTALDLEIASSLAFRIPAAASADGWGVHFGRELNATEDRPHFVEGPGLPVIEGKHLRAFGVDVDRTSWRIPRATCMRLLGGDEVFGRARLAYRDVSSASNRMTLIAAIVPANTVTTHTVFCLKEALDEDAQLYLCGLFNSYVANYLVRMRVGTHVTTAIVAALPLPRPAAETPEFRAIVSCARRLAVENHLPTQARLQSSVAGLYGLTRRQFGHVLETFPLADADERGEAWRLFVKDNV